MLDIHFIQENPQQVQKAAADKGVKVDIQELLNLDEQSQRFQREVQVLREERNVIAKSITGKPTAEQVEKGKKVKEELDKKEAEFQKVETELKALLFSIPNPAKPDV